MGRNCFFTLWDVDFEKKIVPSGTIIKYLREEQEVGEVKKVIRKNREIFKLRTTSRVGLHIEPKRAYACKAHMRTRFLNRTQP